MEWCRCGRSGRSRLFKILEWLKHNISKFLHKYVWQALFWSLFVPNLVWTILDILLCLCIYNLDHIILWMDPQHIKSVQKNVVDISDVSLNQVGDMRMHNVTSRIFIHRYLLYLWTIMRGVALRLRTSVT